MKIALFIKPSITKVCFSFLFIICVIGKPAYVHAGFLSDMVTKVIGNNAQAADVAPANTNTEVVHNSQTMPLLEAPINPDVKNIKDEPAVTIVGDQALSSDNITDNNSFNLEKYASSAEINVYTVKKGDTLDSIAKKLKVPKSTIISSNPDVKKSDLINPGQALVIIPVKDIPKADTVEPILPKEEKKVSVVEDVTPLVFDLPKPTAPTMPVVVPQSTQQQEAPSASSTLLDNGQPTGSISGGYIWPFADGVGRVSQGLHADQAYDFAAPSGTPIYAVSNGTVLVSHPTGYNGGYGKYVVINFNDGRQAIFGHMSKVLAESGDVVKQGDVIGYVGSTGHSTGPHVHIGFHGPLGNPYLGLKLNSTDFVPND